MTFEEKLDRLDGLFAWDMGSASSGIKDDDFKHYLNQNLEELHELLTALAKQYMEQDMYSFEDIREMVKWVDREFDCFI